MRRRGEVYEETGEMSVSADHVAGAIHRELDTAILLVLQSVLPGRGGAAVLNQYPGGKRAEIGGVHGSNVVVRFPVQDALLNVDAVGQRIAHGIHDRGREFGRGEEPVPLVLHVDQNSAGFGARAVLAQHDVQAIDLAYHSAGPPIVLRDVDRQAGLRRLRAVYAASQRIGDDRCRRLIARSIEGHRTYRDRILVRGTDARCADEREQAKSGTLAHLGSHTEGNGGAGSSPLNMLRARRSTGICSMGLQREYVRTPQSVRALSAQRRNTPSAWRCRDAPECADTAPRAGRPAATSRTGARPARGRGGRFVPSRQA